MKTTISKLVAILLVFAITTIHSFSQSLSLDEVSGCLVSDVSGKVTFTEPGNPTPKSVTAGMVLSDDATVVVGKKANFTLVCDDRSLAVNKKGTHQMAGLSKEVQANGEVSRFAKMAFAAKGYGEVPPDTSKRNEIRGWGGKDSIFFKLPIGGKIPLQLTTFRWVPLKDGSIYKLTIYQNSKEAPVLSAQTSTASFSFDPSQLAINMGQTYYAQVILASDGAVSSKVVHFSFVPLSMVESAMASLAKDKDFKSGNAAQQALMQAAELENLELFSLANEKYLLALKLDGNNSMAKRMYVAFLNKVEI